MAIPRRLVQTFSDRARLPPVFIEAVQRLREMNPDWVHEFYDDAARRAFIKDHYWPEMLALYDRINPVYGPARADFFRYLELYRKGGVYLDIKSSVTRPLDTVLDPAESYILSHWRNGPGEPFERWGLYPGLGPRGEFQQWHIIAEPEHPFLAAVILEVSDAIMRYPASGGLIGKTGVIVTTGPYVYSRAIDPIRTQHGHRLLDIEDLGVRYSIFGDDQPFVHERHFAGHYHASREPVILPQR